MNKLRVFIICKLVKLFNWKLCKEHRVYVSKFTGRVFVVLGFGVYRADSLLPLALDRSTMSRTLLTPNELHKQCRVFNAMHLIQ